jgi:Mrp family chromosome partitioning ATPase
VAELGIQHNRKKRNHPAESGLALQQAVVFMLFLGMLISAGALVFIIQSKGASLFGENKESHSTARNHHDSLAAPNVSRVEYQAKLDKAQSHLQELEKAFRKDREETIREHTQEAEQQATENPAAEQAIEISSHLSPQSQFKLIQAKHELKLINKSLSHLKSVMNNATDSHAVIPVSNTNSASSRELPEQSFILGDTAYTAPAPADYKKMIISSDLENDIQPATLENEAKEASASSSLGIPFLPPEAEPSLAKLSSSIEEDVPGIETQVIALQKKLLKTEIEVLEIESQENKLANKLIQPVAWHNSKQFYAKQARQTHLEESLKQLKNDILDLDTAIPDLKAATPQQAETSNKENLKKSSSAVKHEKVFAANHYRTKSNPFHELAGYQVFPNRDIPYKNPVERQILAKAMPETLIKPIIAKPISQPEAQEKHPVKRIEKQVSIQKHDTVQGPDWRKKAFLAVKNQAKGLQSHIAGLRKSAWAKNTKKFWPWELLFCLSLGIGLYSLLKSRKANAACIAKVLPSAYPGSLPWVSKHQWKYHREHNRLELVTELVPEFNQAIEDYTQKLRHHRQESSPSVLLASAISDDEGQESLIANLALGLTQHGEKVLLIDANLQAPKLHQAFNHELDYERGLPELLNWIAEKKQHAQLSLHLDSAIEQHLYDFITASGLQENLHYLNAGCATSESLSFFQDQGLQTLINSCKHFYDWIIINAPPLLKEASEVEALSIPVDGLLLMVERYSPERKIQKASEQIEALNCPIFATVTRL